MNAERVILSDAEQKILKSSNILKNIVRYVIFENPNENFLKNDEKLCRHSGMADASVGLQKKFL